MTLYYLKNESNNIVTFGVKMEVNDTKICKAF